MKLLNDYIQLCRLNRPIGVWLLLFPGFVGLSISPPLASLSYFAIFAVGAVAMRSAGCIYNDIVDRPFDGKVIRTKNRPLVREKNTVSLRTAVAFLAVNLIVGLACLLQFNTITLWVGVCAAAMIAAYPWMKRITYWPQLFLGFTMNMGFVLGCFAVNERMGAGAILLYLGMVCWTLGYDTLYGFQDMEDDALIGVKSSSLKFKQSPRLFVFFAYAGASLLWSIAGVFLNLGLGYCAGVCMIALLFFWHVATLKSHTPSNCLVRFKTNQWVGMVLWCAVLFGR